MSVPLHSDYSFCGPVALIAFTGELEVTTAPRAGAQLIALIEAGAREILVDLNEVEFMGSAGIGVLDEAARAVAARGGRLYVFRAAAQPRRAIEYAQMPVRVGLV